MRSLGALAALAALLCLAGVCAGGLPTEANPCAVPYGTRRVGAACPAGLVCAARDGRASCVGRPGALAGCAWPRDTEAPVCCKYRAPRALVVVETVRTADECACRAGIVVFDAPCEAPPHSPGCEPTVHPVCCFRPLGYLTFTARNECECRPGKVLHDGMCGTQGKRSAPAQRPAGGY